MENSYFAMQEALNQRRCGTCNTRRHDHLLLVCDLCNMCYHTYCIGLRRVPELYWYCEGCTDQISRGPITDPTMDIAFLEEVRSNTI